jgi:hypothetical protein
MALLLLLTSAIACNNDDEEQDFIQALTENDFSNDATIFARLDGLILNFLESPDSEKTENDTGETGNDVIPVTYQRTVEHTFCWEDDNEEAEHFMELADSEGTLILRLDANGDCVTETIEAGNYIVTLFHDGLSEDVQPIFWIPDGFTLIREEQANNQLIHYYRLVKATALNYIQNNISKDANAQTVQENVKTLLSTNSCVDCNLTGANLTGANLTRAILCGAILSGADLTGAILLEADLIGANLGLANLLDATILTSATLTGADLTRANLSEAFLNGANLSGANLTEVILDDTIFDFAIWCVNLCTCGANSIDTCVGCASIDICTEQPEVPDAECVADCDALCEKNAEAENCEDDEDDCVQICKDICATQCTED